MGQSETNHTEMMAQMGKVTPLQLVRGQQCLVG